LFDKHDTAKYVLILQDLIFINTKDMMIPAIWWLLRNTHTKSLVWIWRGC